MVHEHFVPRQEEVSVIVPVYNNVTALRRALLSIQEQTHAPSEVLIVDDGSDWPADTVESLAAGIIRTPWRVIRHEKNLGPSAARNSGWAVARSKWLAFLDADEVWHVRKLEIMMDVIGSLPGAGAVGHATSVESILPSREPYSRWVDSNRALPELVGLEQLLWRNWFTTPAMMVKRELPLRFDYSLRYGEDYLLWCEIASSYPVYFHSVTLGYRLPERGLSANFLAMERSELGVIGRFYRKGQIGPVRLLATWSWSLARFARRVLVAKLNHGDRS